MQHEFAVVEEFPPPLVHLKSELGLVLLLWFLAICSHEVFEQLLLFIPPAEQPAQIAQVLHSSIVKHLPTEPFRAFLQSVIITFPTAAVTVWLSSRCILQLFDGDSAAYLPSLLGSGIPR